jgi:hypothetical protein
MFKKLAAYLTIAAIIAIGFIGTYGAEIAFAGTSGR